MARQRTIDRLVKRVAELTDEFNRYDKSAELDRQHNAPMSAAECDTRALMALEDLDRTERILHAARCGATDAAVVAAMDAGGEIPSAPIKIRVKANEARPIPMSTVLTALER
jgi:hypothetical protein